MNWLCAINCTRLGKRILQWGAGHHVYKLILNLTDGVSWPLSLQAAWLSSPA